MIKRGAQRKSEVMFARMLYCYRPAPIYKRFTLIQTAKHNVQLSKVPNLVEFPKTFPFSSLLQYKKKTFNKTTLLTRVPGESNKSRRHDAGHAAGGTGRTERERVIE